MSDAARIDSLPALEAAIWRELQTACLHKGHPWRLAVLATADGMSADARSVVLRHVDAGTRELIFYTTPSTLRHSTRCFAQKHQRRSRHFDEWQTTSGRTCGTRRLAT